MNKYGQLIDASFWPFFNLDMDRRTDQQTYLLIEMQFYISVMFLGLPDNIQEETFFSSLKKLVMDQWTNWRMDQPMGGPTDGQTLL